MKTKKTSLKKFMDDKESNTSDISNSSLKEG